MKIINKVTDEDYVQWIERFVSKVLKHAHIKYDETVIADIEPSRRIFIFVNGEEYTIRTWNYRPIKYDNNNKPCAENVVYTLYKISGNHGVDVDDGCIKIEWVNKDDDGMPNEQAINLLFHIGNNIDKIAYNDEDAEVYLQAIEKAINVLKD